MEAIVAVDENWGIGYNDELLCKIPGDMKHFKELTENKLNVVGAKTFDTLPSKYRNRIKNWVIFSSKYNTGSYALASVLIEEECKFRFEYKMNFNELEQFIQENRDGMKLTNDNIIFVGGEKVYKHFYEFFHKIYVTKIHKSFDKVNKYFPRVDQDVRFEITDIETHEENRIKYDFITYERKEITMDRTKFADKLFTVKPYNRELIKEFVGLTEETKVCTSPVDGDAPNPLSLIIMMEEFSEATKEISKILRGEGDDVALLEEMADVQICVYKFQRLFGITDDTFNKALTIKIQQFDEKYPQYKLKEFIDNKMNWDKE